MTKMWLCFVCFLLRILLAEGSWNIVVDIQPLANGTFRNPVIICDAGSTGSRVYAFHVPLRNYSHEEHPVVELLGRTETGLSEFASAGLFQNASTSILALIQRGINRLGPNVPVYIFATGGVRSLDQNVRQKLWESMKSDLGKALSQVHAGMLSIRVVDGADEALYGLVSSNYLVGDLSPQNVTGSLLAPVGVLDLGGSSLEMSLVGDDLRAGTDDDLLISFRSLGMFKFRNKVEQSDPSGYCRFESVCSPQAICFSSTVGEWTKVPRNYKEPAEWGPRVK